MENAKFLEIKSRYNEQKQHCSLAGTFMICGIEGRFEVHTVGGCCTRVTGRVSLISPLDGKILLFDGARRRELITKRAEDQKSRIRTEKRPRELKATKELNVEIVGVDLDPKTHAMIFPQDSVHMIQNAVKSKAEKLYAEAQPTLARMLEQQGLGQNVTALRLYYARAKGFFATEVPVKDATRRRNSNSLQKMCVALGETAIADISPRDANQLTANFSKTEVHRLERFLNYCREKGDFSCTNPVTEYASAQKHARNFSAERTRAARMHGISLEAERMLLKLAEDHIADGRVCAIAFALGAGLGIDEMLRLRWSDVQCKNNQVYLELQSDNSGATHNYSRPPLPFAQEILQARCDWLHERYTRGFSNFPVVSDRDDPRKSISRSALTDFSVVCEATPTGIKGHGDGVLFRPNGVQGHLPIGGLRHGVFQRLVDLSAGGKAGGIRIGIKAPAQRFMGRAGKDIRGQLGVNRVVDIRLIVHRAGRILLAAFVKVDRVGLCRPLRSVMHYLTFFDFFGLRCVSCQI